MDEATRVANGFAIAVLLEKLRDHGVGFLEATLTVLAQQVQLLSDEQPYIHKTSHSW